MKPTIIRVYKEIILLRIDISIYFKEFIKFTYLKYLNYEYKKIKLNIILKCYILIHYSML